MAGPPPPASAPPPRPRWLIVNGDDLGLTAGVNTGIERAFQSGILRSASAMAPGAALADAAERAKRLPDLGIGLHLTLVGEAPVCRPEEVPSLVGRDGRLLPGYRAFVLRYLRGGIRPADLRRELSAQAAALTSHGLTLDHLDSHQHLHLLPGLLGPTLSLAREYGIRWVRAPRSGVRGQGSGVRGQGAEIREQVPPVRSSGHQVIRSSPSTRPRVERWLFAAASAWARNRVAGAGLPLLEGSLGFDCAGHLSPEYLLQHIPALPDGVTELICHPGEGDPESSARYGAWGYEWQRELEALTDPAVRSALECAGVQLISFGELGSREAAKDRNAPQGHRDTERG